MPKRRNHSTESIATDDDHHEPRGVETKHSVNNKIFYGDTWGDDDNNENVENADDNDNEDLPDTNHEPTHEIRWSPRDGPLPSYLQW